MPPQGFNRSTVFKIFRRLSRSLQIVTTVPNTVSVAPSSLATSAGRSAGPAPAD